MRAIQLGLIDYVILGIYFVFVLGIGFAVKRYQRTSEDFSCPVDRCRHGWPDSRFFPRTLARRKS